MESSAQPHDIAELFHTCQSFPAPHRTLTACPSLGRDRMRRQPSPEENLPRPFSLAAEATRQSKSLHLWLATSRMPSSGSGAPNCAKMAQFRPRNRHGGGREGIRRGKGEGVEGPLQCAVLAQNPLFVFAVKLQSLPSKAISFSLYRHADAVLAAAMSALPPARAVTRTPQALLHFAPTTFQEGSALDGFSNPVLTALVPFICQ